MSCSWRSSVYRDGHGKGVDVLGFEGQGRAGGYKYVPVELCAQLEVGEEACCRAMSFDEGRPLRRPDSPLTPR